MECDFILTEGNSERLPKIATQASASELIVAEDYYDENIPEQDYSSRRVTFLENEYSPTFSAPEFENAGSKTVTIRLQTNLTENISKSNSAFSFASFPRASVWTVDLSGYLDEKGNSNTIYIPIRHSSILLKESTR